MKQDELDLRQALDYIDPRELSYSEWVGVGMGLKEAGYPVGLWEDWSRRDGGRYRTGECARKSGQLSRHGHAHHGGNHRADGAARRLAAERRRL